MRHNMFIRRHKHKITAQKVPRLRRLVYHVDIRETKGRMLTVKKIKWETVKCLMCNEGESDFITFLSHVSALWSGLFIGAFAKLRKAIISLFRSVCLSVSMQQSNSYWMDFYYISYLSIFRKYVKKIQDILKPEINKRYITWVGPVAQSV